MDGVRLRISFVCTWSLGQALYTELAPIVESTELEYSNLSGNPILFLGQHFKLSITPQFY